MMSGASMWSDCFVRGPPCGPSVSGRVCVERIQLSRHIVAPRCQRQRRVRRSAAQGAFALQLASQTTVTEQRVATYTVQEIDDLQIEQPSPPPDQTDKPLKINMDLRLYRARLDRLQAQLTSDHEQRKRLLRASEQQLRQCLAMDAADARTYVVLGKLLVQQKRYEEARVLYAEGTRNTGNSNPYIWAAWGYLEATTGNVTRARKLLDAAVVVDETHAAAWHKWGMLEMRQGNYLRARDLWTTGIQRSKKLAGNNKSSTYLYCSLAVMAGELGKLAEARAWFEEGTRLNEGKASCALWHAWAMLESRIGDGSAVRYLFKRALQANPRSRYTHLAWALWERQQGNDRACLSLLQRGLAMNPQDPALYQVLGLVAAEVGQLEEARRYFQAGLQVDPRHVHLWQAWAVMEARASNLDRARQLFQEGVWADPGNTDAVVVFQAWGVLEMRAGNHSLARELFKAALKVDPKNESAWGTWIAMEDDLGRADAANELRIRRSEQQWEFVIPASFSTRPEGNTLLGSLLNTLNTFFGRRRQQDSSSREAPSSSSSSSNGSSLLSQLLPPDFRDDVKLEDMIAGATAAEVQGLQDLQVEALTAAAAPAASTSSTGSPLEGRPSDSSRGPSSSSSNGNGTRRVPPSPPPRNLNLRRRLAPGSGVRPPPQLLRPNSPGWRAPSPTGAAPDAAAATAAEAAAAAAPAGSLVSASSGRADTPDSN